VKTIFLSLLLLICLQPLMAQEEKTIHINPESLDTLWYQTHGLIAILPFSMEAREDRYKKMFDAQLVKDQTIFSMQVQQAFYNSIMNDDKRWHVSVQDCRVTDSLLERARVNLPKVNYLDKRALAAYLKVDAIIIGWLDDFYVPGPATAGKTKLSTLVMSLYDGKSGDLLWGFSKEIHPEDVIGNYYRLNTGLYDEFRKKCPYTSGKFYRTTIYQ
jgi:hypothetical protein